MKFSKLALIIILHQYFVLFVFGQPPANDNCAGAVLLTSAENYCDYFSSTTLNATDSGMSDACNAVGDDDVWFKFVVTNPVHWVTVYPNNSDVAIVFYTGSCSNLDSLTCANESMSGYGEAVFLENLTVGDTVFCRVFEAGITSTAMDFFICVVGPPANDSCINATEIIPIYGEGVTYDIITAYALDENISAGACSTVSPHDIWYRFVATTNWYSLELHSFNQSRPSANRNTCETIAELRNDPCGGSEISCFSVDCYDGSSSLERTDFVIGDTYFIRVYKTDNSDFNSTSLTLRQPIPQPHDSCIAAEILNVHPEYCDNSSYNNQLGGATETLSPLDTCSTGPYYDLWFKFEVTDTTAIIKAKVNSSGNIGISSFSGTSCNTLTHLKCSDTNDDGEDELLYLTGLDVGDTIYVRVYDADMVNTPINFSICVYTPPANDFCSNATEIITTNGANCSGSIIGNTQGATGTGGCAGGSADDDVWYWFTATDTLQSLQLSNLNITLPVIEVFNNNCGGSQFGCIQGTKFISSDFIIGQVYYVRIYSTAENNGNGSFDLCISEPPINILCNEAITLSTNTGTDCTTVYAGSSVGQGNSYAKYQFEATANTQIVYVTPLSPMSAISNTNQIFDNNCDLISLIGYDYFSGTQRTYYKNFTIGQHYKFEVTNGFPTEGNYDVCITEALENDECISAVAIPNSLINPNCDCDLLISGTCKGATPSDASPPMGHDVWYSFNASSSSMAFSLFTANGSTNVSGVVYSNCSTSIGFIGLSGLTLTNLVIGNEYKIRVKAIEDDEKPSDFNLCIKSLTNDFCANPITIIPQADTTCGSPTTGSTIGATASNISACLSSNNNKKDVWFQFTATASKHLIKVNPTTSGFYPSLFVYRKSTGSLNCDINCIHSSFDCINFGDTIDYMPNVALLNSLTVGVTYLISVANNQQDSPSGDFNICVLTPGNNMNVWSTQVETYSTTAAANAGRYEFPMKRIKLNMTGTTSPSIVTQIVVNTSGTTSTSDLLSTKLYYAGAVNVSSPQGSMPEYKSIKDAGEVDAILFATAVANPNGQLVFNGALNIVGQSGEYHRYFFLVYDMACDATIGNQVNAEVESITISTVTHIPFEAVNTPNTIETQNRIFTKADGFWSDPNTWICGVPPNGPDILPITMNHTVTVDDGRQCGNINLSYLKGLSISAGGVLTMGQSSEGTQTGHSNKFLNAQWGLLSVYGTLNVNGGLRVGEYSSNGSNHFGQLAIEGTVNIDGNDGTEAGSGYSSLFLGTPTIYGSGFINILDPSYNTSAYEFVYDSWYNINRNVNWTITFGGGDDNSIENGFDVDMIDLGTGSDFSTLTVKDVNIFGGLLNEKREVNVRSTLLPCQNLNIGQGAEIIGRVGLSGNLSNEGFFTDGNIIFAKNFSWNSFAINTVNQYVTGSGFYRATTSSPYPSSSAENSVYGLLVQSSANVFLSSPIEVREKLMIKSGTIITTDTSVLSLGTGLSNSGQLCQTNSSAFHYSATEFTGSFESWTGGGVQGPFRRYFHNNTNLENKGFMPLKHGANIRNIGFKLKNNALIGSITASFNGFDYGSRCLPLLNEQGIDITNVSPTGFWKFISDNLSGEYDISTNANGFNKRGGGTITDLTNVRTLISPNIPTYIHSKSTNLAGPSLLSKVILHNISCHQDTFVLCIGGGANAVGHPLSASTYIVNSINDFGLGSFRDAIISTFCNDTIRFDHSLDNDTIQLTSILPPVDKNVIVIMEPNQNIVIKNQTNDVILDIPPYYELELINTNILGNHTSSFLIYNQGLLILDNCTISNANMPNAQPLLLNDGSGQIIIKNVSVIKE